MHIGNSNTGRVQASISVSMRCVDVAQTLRIFMVCSDFFFSWDPMTQVITSIKCNVFFSSHNICILYYVVYKNHFSRCFWWHIMRIPGALAREPFRMWRGFPPVSLPHGCRIKRPVELSSMRHVRGACVYIYIFIIYLYTQSYTYSILYKPGSIYVHLGTWNREGM